MTGQRGAGSPFSQAPTHHTDDTPWWWWTALTAGCVAVGALILGVIPWACGAWT